MRKILLSLLCVLSFGAGAQSHSIPIYQRCFFNGHYDAGFFSNNTRDMIIKNMFGQSLDNYFATYAVAISTIPKEWMQPGTELSDLLEMKLVRIARAFRSPLASYEIMVINNTNFNFARENTDLSGMILVFNGFQDRFEIIERMMREVPFEVLVLDTSDARKTLDVSCNVEFTK